MISVTKIIITILELGIEDYDYTEFNSSPNDNFGT